MTDSCARVAVVTGAASGIGAEIADVLAEAGYRLALVDKNDAVHAKAEAMAQEGLEATAFKQDLLQLAAIPDLGERILRDMGRCDILVNNAGCHFKTPDGHRFEFAAVRLAEWDMSVALHMTVPLLLAQRLLPDMVRRKWGRVINISSRSGRTYLANTSASYSATKAGLIGLTRSMAGEYAPFGVTCNAIAPGRFTTPGTDICAADVKASVLKEVLVGREGEPREIGELVRYLASDQSGFITGVTIDISGGSFMAP